MSAATIALADVRETQRKVISRMAAARRAEALKWAALGQRERSEFAAGQADAFDLTARLIFEMIEAGPKLLTGPAAGAAAGSQPNPAGHTTGAAVGALLAAAIGPDRMRTA